MNTDHTSPRFLNNLESLTMILLLAALLCLSATVGYERGSRHSDIRVKIPLVRTHLPDTILPEDTNHQQYWISEIIKASGRSSCDRTALADTAGPIASSTKLPADYWKKEVHRIVDREQNKPLEMMLFDKYYWTHYLLEHRLEVE